MRPLRGQNSLPFDQGGGRPCLACGGATKIIAGGLYSGPVEKCTRCNVSRDLPGKSRPSGREGRA